jgi:hypothetical protein
VKCKVRYKSKKSFNFPRNKKENILNKLNKLPIFLYLRLVPESKIVINYLSHVDPI